MSNELLTDQPATGTEPSILVLDRASNAAIIGKRLRRAGFAVVVTEDGLDALTMMMSRPVDLALIDMNLPHMPGLRVLQEIRRTARIAQLPVMMMTSRTDPAAAITALDAGADDHIAKPFDFDILSARIRRLVNRNRAMVALQQTNATLDARIADRAVALGEVRAALHKAEADRARLASSIRMMETQLQGQA
jgi:DNA-binding response OmpR family regulator